MAKRWYSVSVLSNFEKKIAEQIRQSAAEKGLETFEVTGEAAFSKWRKLPRENAILLTRQLVDLVKPGGEFLFANFSTGVVPDGYMETFMNWPLILRDETEMWDIVNASVDRNTVEADVFFGENRHIIYAKIRRKAG